MDLKTCPIQLLKDGTCGAWSYDHFSWVFGVHFVFIAFISFPNFALEKLVFVKMISCFFGCCFSFCFRVKELVRAVISLVRKVPTDIWARRKVKKKLQKVAMFTFLLFTSLRRENHEDYWHCQFRNFFLTFLRAQRSDETFRTREMTARASSFKKKQKENLYSKKPSRILTKTCFFSAVKGKRKPVLSTKRAPKMHEISKFRSPT